MNIRLQDDNGFTVLRKWIVSKQARRDVRREGVGFLELFPDNKTAEECFI